MPSRRRSGWGSTIWPFVETLVCMVRQSYLLSVRVSRSNCRRCLQKITLLWSTMEAVSRSGYPNLCSLTPEKRVPPHPPTLWKSFFGPLIAFNLHDINSLHFFSVDESVTANPRFCPFFGLFWGQKGPKLAVFDGFLHGYKPVCGNPETPRPAPNSKSATRRRRFHWKQAEIIWLTELIQSQNPRLREEPRGCTWNFCCGEPTPAGGWTGCTDPG